MLQIQLLPSHFYKTRFTAYWVPAAAHFSTQCAVNTKFMNLPWLEGESEIFICTSNKTISFLRIIKGNYTAELFGCRFHCLVMVGEIR